MTGANAAGIMTIGAAFMMFLGELRESALVVPGSRATSGGCVVGWVRLLSGMRSPSARGGVLLNTHRANCHGIVMIRAEVEISPQVAHVAHACCRNATNDHFLQNEHSACKSGASTEMFVKDLSVI